MRPYLIPQFQQRCIGRFLDALSAITGRWKVIVSRHAVFRTDSGMPS